MPLPYLIPILFLYRFYFLPHLPFLLKDLLIQVLLTVLLTLVMQ